MSHVAMPAEEPVGAVGLHGAHPLAASVAAVDRAVASLSFRTLDAAGSPWPGSAWIGCEHALADPDFFVRWRVEAAHWLAEHHSPECGQSQVPERTTAGYVLRRYLMIPGYLGGFLFHSARRVPLLAPGQLGFRLDAGALREVVLRPDRFWCLPGDPDAGHRDAVVVADEVALGVVLRRQLVAHAARFLTVYGPQVRFGRRAQWATVTEVLDGGLLLAGRSFGSPQAGAADARLVLVEGARPLTSASTIREVTDEHGRTHWARRRGSCCFLYALPGIDHPCASCPRITDAERARILGRITR